MRNNDKGNVYLLKYLAVTNQTTSFSPNVPMERCHRLSFLLPTNRPDGTNFTLLPSQRDDWWMENRQERSIGTPGEMWQLDLHPTAQKENNG